MSQKLIGHLVHYWKWRQYRTRLLTQRGRNIKCPQFFQATFFISFQCSLIYSRIHNKSAMSQLIFCFKENTGRYLTNVDPLYQGNPSPDPNEWTHWGLDQHGLSCQTTLSNTCSWEEKSVCCFQISAISFSSVSIGSDKAVLGWTVAWRRKYKRLLP